MILTLLLAALSLSLPTDVPEKGCGYVEPPRTIVRGTRTLAAEAFAPALGLRHVLVVNGSSAAITGDVEPFWSALSYGQVTFDTSSANASFATPCDLRPTVANMVAALDPVVDFTRVDHVVIWASTSGCTYAGIGGIFRDYVTADGVVTFGAMRMDLVTGASRTARHEFGHTFGLTHSRAWPCLGVQPGGVATCGTPVEYGGYDVMGAGSYGVNAMMREQLGWITQEQPVPGTYKLVPLSQPSGLRAIKVMRTQYDYLSLEYGPSGGLHINTNWTQISGNVGGATTIPYPLQVKLQSVYPSNVLPPGATFVDGGTGARVSVSSADSTGVTVTIEDPGVPDTGVPSCAYTSPVATSGVVNLNPYTIYGGTMLLGASGTDDRGIYRALWRVNQGGYWRASPAAYTAPYEVLFDLDTLPYDGYTVIPSWVYDAAGNQAWCGTICFSLVRNVTTSPTPTPTPTPTPVVTNPPTPTPTPGPCWPPKSKRCRG